LEENNMIKEIKSEKEFKENVLDSTDAVLVDFNATWCGPCKMQRPILENLSKDYKIVSVDTDENEELAYQYKVMSIPCMVLIKDGKEVKRMVGLHSEEDIKEFMK